jgi:hypothetical protein
MKLKLTIEDIVLKLLDLTQNPMPGAIEDLATAIGIPEDDFALRIRFGNEMKEQLRLIPLKVYTTPENRELVMRNVQQELDDLVARIEEVEEEEEARKSAEEAGMDNENLEDPQP